MIEFGKEYFNKPYYFYLKDRGNTFSVYFSVSETLNESRQNDEEVVLLKESLTKVKNFIKNLFKKGYKFTKEQIKKILNWFKKRKPIKKTEKKEGEIQEFVGADGSFMKSNIPMLNQRQIAKSTTDQTVHMTRANQFPFIRVYYGESEKEKNNLIDEVDQSEAFGYEETKDAKSYKEASEILKDMGVDDPFERHERLETMGFDPAYDKDLKKLKNNGYCKNCFSKRRLAELEKRKMQKMIDEIILGKKSKSSDVLKKKDDSSDVMEKLLIRNLQSIKKLADKQGLELSDLLKKLNKSE